MTVSKFVQEFDRVFSHAAWALIGLLFAVTFISTTIPVHRTYRNWSAASEFGFWYGEFSLALFTFLVGWLPARAFWRTWVGFRVSRLQFLRLAAACCTFAGT